MPPRVKVSRRTVGDSRRQKELSMQNSIACGTETIGASQRQFAEFMHEQLNRIEKFRKYLCKHGGTEISLEQAVNIWIERGYAAAFRRRYGQKL
jgi:hypothetical protein